MKQLDRKAVWLFFFSSIFRLLWVLFILFIWALLAFGERTDSSVDMTFSSSDTILLILAFLVICFIWSKLTYHFYKYELVDAGFRKESGVIYKKYTTIPYDRIQNVDIYRGILARILGPSDLHVQTAGSSAVYRGGGLSGINAEGRLVGLSKEVAEQLRDELINRARQSRTQGV